MIDVNEARYQWLITRNKDLMDECNWRLESLIKMENKSVRNFIYTDSFVAEFNSVHEILMLIKYIKGLGYDLRLERVDGDERDTEGETPTSRLIRIGI